MRGDPSDPDGRLEVFSRTRLVLPWLRVGQEGDGLMARRSKVFERLMEYYPGVVESYELVRPTKRSKQMVHHVQLARGWHYRGDHPWPHHPGGPAHEGTFVTGANLRRRWYQIEPCDCDNCVGADRGDALHVWRQYEWLPDNQPMIWYLAYQISGGDPHPPGLHVLSDETAVLVDVELEKMQGGR
jgi:hypothetical protein